MSAEEWIDCPAPRRTLGSALWGRVFARICGRLAFGNLMIRLPDGSARLVRGRFGGDTAELRVHRPLRLVARLLTRGDIGFGEAYMEGHWSSPDLPALLAVLHLNAEHLGTGWEGTALSRWLDRHTHRRRDNHRVNSRRNIARHYDLGNDFYRLWLDPGMTYSAAVFDTPGVGLEQAQDRKYARLLDWLDARPGEHILEIGCGWGGLAEAAARRGLRVTGVTLSQAQLDYARARIERAGLGHLVELRLQDYRDIRGQFDHAVSIEMLEAVGEPYWPAYFAALRRLVRPGGRVAIQAITIHEDDFAHYQRTADFIQLYIFPGGMLPSPERLRAEIRDAGLRLREEDWRGGDYAETLRRWRAAFHRVEDAVAAQGYDPMFRRMWDYYLAYCEAGFDSGSIDLAQVCLEVPAATSADPTQASEGATLSLP
jgi:cyclopropane-fatty-acyl-phospholipid synthase